MFHVLLVDQTQQRDLNHIVNKFCACLLLLSEEILFALAQVLIQNNYHIFHSKMCILYLWQLGTFCNNDDKYIYMTHLIFTSNFSMQLTKD